MFGVVLLLTQLDSTIWPSDCFSHNSSNRRFEASTHSSACWSGSSPSSSARSCSRRGAGCSRHGGHRAGARGDGGVVLGLGFGLQQLYLRDRYLNTPPMAPLYAWAKHVEDTRMAVTGPFSNDSYPLYGQDDSNYVQIVGKSGPSGSFAPIASCGEFRRVIDAGHYADVITITAGGVRDAADDRVTADDVDQSGPDRQTDLPPSGVRFQSALQGNVLFGLPPRRPPRSGQLPVDVRRGHRTSCRP